MSRKRDEFGKRSYGEIENGLKIFCQREAKKFLDGGSGNMTRDNIRVQAARQAEEPETELAENDFDDMLQEALGAK